MNNTQHRATVLLDADLYTWLVAIGGGPRKISQALNAVLRQERREQEDGPLAGRQVMVPASLWGSVLDYLKRSQGDERP